MSGRRKPAAASTVLMRHPFCRYGYQMIESRRFDRYGLEQQAEMVRDCFLADAEKPQGR
jgi:hypothetical protein